MHLSSTVDDSCCFRLATPVFVAMLFAILGDLAGTLINIVLLDFVGRKASMFGMSILGAFACCFLTACGSNVVTTILLFLLRAAGMGVLSGIVVYTSEIYPTTVRTLSIGFLSAIGHVGSGLATIFALVVIKYSGVPTMMTFSVMYVFVALLISCLPLDTKRRPMHQTLLRTSDYGRPYEYATFKEN